ncbi:MAG: HlyD family efflux transporter periplasmic adaptor subunit [Tepidiphilus sp.]|jgi:HlyD family secretion protein|nr:HlyD family efflux transporter periplasmic adaptor subunit [Tepidiphilus sp.]MDD3432269.1 HlyD family efflux transporter periplasmic adaptor subunit [Tepidiphilus sp.]
MSPRLKTLLIRAVLVALLAGGALWFWQRIEQSRSDGGIVSSNGRIEAIDVNISAKLPGRIEDIFADEGDLVARGQVVAKLDTSVLEAQLREARAQHDRARMDLESARSLLAQREADKAATEALVVQRLADLDMLRKRLARTRELARQDMATQSRLDEDSAAVDATQAAVVAARAQVRAAEAAIIQSRAAIAAAEAQVAATSASIERIQADIDDSLLRAPRDGRVQYRIAQPGEVVAAGGAVLNVVDLSDVYMTFFLPTQVAGKVAIGSEVRLVLDAFPQYVIPATATFVSDVAQFTPKTVETAEERQKLMFRVKASIDPDLLRQHLPQVKTGLPGMAYLKLDPQRDWPAHLQVKVP